MIKSCQIRILMRHAEKNDLDMCEQIVNGAATREEIESMPVGTGIVIGFTPKPMIVKFDMRQSKDLSETPKIDRLRQPRQPQQPQQASLPSINTMPVSKVSQSEPLVTKKVQSQTTLDLDTVLALADKVDNETLLALIDRLPVVRDGEDIDTGELAIVDDDETKLTARLDDEVLMSPVLHQNQDNDMYQKGIVRQHETPKPPVPIMPDKGTRTDDIPINTLVTVWNNLSNEDKTVDGLAEAFNCNRNQAYKAYKRIQTCFNAALQKEE